MLRRAAATLLLAMSAWLAVEIGRVRASAVNNDALVKPWVLAAVSLVLLAVICGVARGVPRRARVGLAGAAAVVGAASLLVAGWAGFAPLPRQQHVQMPGAAASPVAVVRAYIAALNDHDLGTMRALGAPGTPAASSDDPYVSIHLVKITRLVPAPVGVGQEVDVIIRSQLRSFGASPLSVTDWGYVLSPTGPAHAWRIADEGVG